MANPQVLLPPEVHHKLKVFCAVHKREMREVAATAINEYMKNQAKAQQEEPIAS